MRSLLKNQTVLTALAILFCGMIVAGVFIFSPSEAEAANCAGETVSCGDGGVEVCCAGGVNACQLPGQGYGEACDAGPASGSPTQAQTTSPPRAGACGTYDFGCKFFQFLSYLLLTLSGFVLWLAGTFFDVVVELSVKNMADFVTGAAGIEIAWRVLRDVVNMVFIFALLYIAIATILRIEEYGAKRLLSRLIIIALLINFSLFFTKVVIDASNVLTAEFTDGIKALSGEIDLVTDIDPDTDVAQTKKLDSISGAFVKPLMLTTLYGKTVGEAPTKLEADTVLTIGFYGSIFLLIAAFIFFAGGVLLAIRFVMFIFLMVSSPIAFAGMLLPITRSYAQQWWTQLFKYAIFAPVYMALLLAVGVIVNNKSFQTSLAGEKIDVLNQGFIGLMTSGDGRTTIVVLNFFVVSGLMIAALVAAQQMGVRGAQALSNLGYRMVARTGELGLQYAGRKYNEWTGDYILGKGKGTRSFWRKTAFAVVNPVAFARGWAERREELTELAKSGAAAQGRMVAEQFITSPITSPKDWLNLEAWKRGGKLQIDYATISDRQDENQFMDDYTGMRKESLMHAAVQVESMGGVEGGLRKRAIIKAAATQGYLDDILRMRVFAEKYGEADGTIYSAAVLNRFLYDYLGDDHTAQRFMAEDMEDLGKRTGHYEYLGHAFFNPETGEYERGFEKTGGTITNFAGQEIDELKNTWQAGYAGGELAKISGRERLRIAPHNFTSLRAELEDGQLKDTGSEIKDHIVFGTENGELDDFQKAILAQIGAGDLRELHHSQSRTKHWLLGKEFDRNTGEIILESEEEAKKLKALWKENPEYVRGLYGQFFGYAYNDAVKYLPGVKIAYYGTYENGHERKMRVSEELRAGNSRGVKHPIIAKVTGTFSENPDLKLGEFEEKTSKQIKTLVEKHVRDVFGGKIPRTQIEEEFGEILTAPGSGPIPEGINAEHLTNELYKTIENTIRENYDPIPVLKKIDSKIKRAAQEAGLSEEAIRERALSIKEMSDIAHALPKTYVEAWRNIAEEGHDLDAEMAAQEFKEAFDHAIQTLNPSLLQRIAGVNGVESLVEQIRPAHRPEEHEGDENTGDNNQTA